MPETKVRPGNIFITGDTHGNFERIEDFCRIFETQKQDVMIILGDAGVNYFLDKRDRKLKRKLEQLPITFMLVRGNHEARPGCGWDKEDSDYDYLIDCPEYAGRFMFEQEFPSILYMMDGETYTFTVRNRQLHALVVGGAYSIDKDYRIEQYDLGNHNYRWYKDEQLNEEEKTKILAATKNEKFDIVFTHTCPSSYVPTETFLPFTNQSTVDRSMEEFLEKVKQQIEFERWYCGHWHIDKNVDKMSFMFNSVAQLGGLYDVYNE